MTTATTGGEPRVRSRSKPSAATPALGPLGHRPREVPPRARSAPPRSAPATARTPGTRSRSTARPASAPSPPTGAPPASAGRAGPRPSSSCACHRTSRGHAFSSDSCTTSTRWWLGSPSAPFTSYDVSSRASISWASTSSAALRSGKTRQQLLPLRHRPRPLRGDQVAEDLPHHRLPLGADAVHRGLGVLGEGAGHTPDLLVRGARQELPLPVPLLPQARDGEGEERQRRRVHPRPTPPSPRPGPRPRSGGPAPSPAPRARAAAPPGSAPERRERRRTPARAARAPRTASGSRPAATGGRGHRPPARGGPRSSAKRACTSSGFSVNSSSNWSTTRSASACALRQRQTTSNGDVRAPRTARAAAAPLGRPPAPRSERLAQTHGRAPPRASNTIAAQPEGRDATTPARTNDVLPAPEGPITARSRRSRSFSHRASTSASRPKKRAGVLLRERSDSPGKGSLPRCPARGPRPPARPGSPRAPPPGRAPSRSGPPVPSPGTAPRSARAPAKPPVTPPTATGADPPGWPSASRPPSLAGRGASPQELVQHHPQREEIAPPVEREAPHLLG